VLTGSGGLVGGGASAAVLQKAVGSSFEEKTHHFQLPGPSRLH
jgi:hypothetical protein